MNSVKSNLISLKYQRYTPIEENQNTIKKRCYLSKFSRKEWAGFREGY